MNMQRILENGVLIVAVVTGVIVSILDLLGYLGANQWLNSERIPTIILLLLSTAILYIAFDNWSKRQHLEKIQGQIKSNTEEILDSLSGVRVAPIMTTEQGFKYLSQRYQDAENSIDQAAIAPSTSYRLTVGKVYEQAITKVLKNPVVKYRYIAVFDEPRWELVQKYLATAVPNKYFVRYYQPNATQIPVYSFSIIDNVEVIVRHPYQPGEPEFWLTIRHPEVVKLFESYYRSLWNNALEVNGSNESLIAKITASIKHETASG